MFFDHSVTIANYKPSLEGLCTVLGLIGGSAYAFLKPENPTELIDDLILLYTKLVDFGVEYRNGKIYLADLEEKDA